MTIQYQDSRVPLPGSDSAQGCQLALDTFNCYEVRAIGAGGSCLAYEACSNDYFGATVATPTRLILKEYYPVALSQSIQRQGAVIIADAASFEQGMASFREGYLAQINACAAFAGSYTLPPAKICEANNTLYIVSNITDGTPLSLAVSQMSISAQVKALSNVCGFLKATHDAGYVYLDLKPSNLLAMKSPEGGYAGAIKLFDFDTMIKLEKLEDDMQSIPSTDGWAAYEQTHFGEVVDHRADIYAAGALLFWMLFERPPSYAEVIHANADWGFLERRHFCDRWSGVSDDALAMVKRILSLTLTTEADTRYGSAQELRGDLLKLHDAVASASEAFIGVMAGESNKEKKSARKALVAAIAATIVVVAGAFFVLFGQAAQVDVAVGKWEAVEFSPGEKNGYNYASLDRGFVSIEIFKDGTCIVDVNGDRTNSYWQYTKEDDIGLGKERFYVLTKEPQGFSSGVFAVFADNPKRSTLFITLVGADAPILFGCEKAS